MKYQDTFCIMPKTLREPLGHTLIYRNWEPHEESFNFLCFMLFLSHAQIYQNSSLDVFFSETPVLKQKHAIMHLKSSVKQWDTHHTDPSLGPCIHVEVLEARSAKNTMILWKHFRQVSFWSAIPSLWHYNTVGSLLPSPSSQPKVAASYSVELQHSKRASGWVSQWNPGHNEVWVPKCC